MRRDEPLRTAPSAFDQSAGGLAAIFTVIGTLEHFQVKWTRFTVENASERKTRAVSNKMESALKPIFGVEISQTSAR